MIITWLAIDLPASRARRSGAPFSHAFCSAPSSVRDGSSVVVGGHGAERRRRSRCTAGRRGTGACRAGTARRCAERQRAVDPVGRAGARGAACARTTRGSRWRAARRRARGGSRRRRRAGRRRSCPRPRGRPRSPTSANCAADLAQVRVGVVERVLARYSASVCASPSAAGRRCAPVRWATGRGVGLLVDVVAEADDEVDVLRGEVARGRRRSRRSYSWQEKKRDPHRLARAGRARACGSARPATSAVAVPEAVEVLLARLQEGAAHALVDREVGGGVGRRGAARRRPARSPGRAPPRADVGRCGQRPPGASTA